VSPEPFVTVNDTLACRGLSTPAKRWADTPTVCPATGDARLGLTDKTATPSCVAAGPTVTVAAGVEVSGMLASGVRANVSVTVGPTPMATGAAASPLTVKPDSVVKPTAALVATLPTFLSVTVAVPGKPGSVATLIGLLAMVTASTTGMANDSVMVR